VGVSELDDALCWHQPMEGQLVLGHGEVQLEPCLNLCAHITFTCLVAHITMLAATWVSSSAGLVAALRVVCWSGPQ
jgi:hypothetical protein